MSETRTLIGKVVKILPARQVSETFKVRDIWIEEPADNPDYNQVVKVQFTQDKCGLLDQYQIGQEVMINFNITGRRSSQVGPTTENIYTNIQGWRIGATASKPVPQQEAAPAAPLPF